MRSLPGIRGKQIIKPAVQFKFTTAPGSVYTFENADINDVSALRWRAPFGGGLGVPSDYEIQVVIELEEQKSIFNEITRSETTLRITAGSEQWFPHFGRITDMSRDENTLDMITFSVVDRWFNDKPLYPLSAIVDSHSGAHAVEIEENAGEPFYYGDESVRDFYMTAIDSTIAQYLGPKNVSSESHIGDIFFNSKPTDQTTQSLNFILTGYGWKESDEIATDIFSNWLPRLSPDSLFHRIREANGFFLLVQQFRVFTNPWLSVGATGWENVIVDKSTEFVTGFVYTGSHYVYSTQNSTNTSVGCTDDPYNLSAINIVTANANDNLYGIEKFGSIYLLPGINNELEVSTDTINWNNFNTGLTIGAADIGPKFHEPNSAFTFVGGFKEIRVSTDFTNWSNVVETFSGNIKGIAYGNGVYVGIDDEGIIDVSTDALNWNETLVLSYGGVGNNPRLFDVAYHDNVFVTVGDNNVSALLGISSDGFSWDFNNLTSVGSLARIVSITVNNGGAWLAHGINNQSDKNLLQSGNLFLADYYKDGVFRPAASSSRIAISENPIAILDDIFSHQASIPYVQSQSSGSQADVTSYKFNCYFGTRESLQDIVNEFGEISGVGIWIGDSGAINYRTYQESAGAAVDKTITTDDIFAGSFKFQANPIGSRVTGSLVSKYRFLYGYDFQRQEHQSALAVNAANNAMCNSLDSAGVRTEEEFNTKFLMNSDVASLWASNRIRVLATNPTLLKMDLPLEFMELEANDVLKIQHPMIIGSETLAQIVDIKLDLLRGKISIQAQELQTYVQ